MTKFLYAALPTAGLAAVLWVGSGFWASNGLALFMTMSIGLVFLAGVWEVWRFHLDSKGLEQSLDNLPQPLAGLSDWLLRLPAGLRTPTQARIELGRHPLPGLALTPYLVGLLVMLGMLGTFLGMVVTFKGAVWALEGAADLQAIRSALAEPIKGLSLSFGTSVAGVATSALLGVMSAVARRERGAVLRKLDAHIANEFRPFSLTHQRREAYQAVLAQSQVLPEVVVQLQSMVQQMDRRHQLLADQMTARQEAFHAAVSVAYTDLARSVTTALADSLASSARQASEQLQPLLEKAISGLSADARSHHQLLQASAERQLDVLTTRFAAMADAVSASWQGAMTSQTQVNDAWVQRLDAALSQFREGFDARASDWLAKTGESSASFLHAIQVDDAARRQEWKQMAADWQRVQQDALHAHAEHVRVQQLEVGEHLRHWAHEVLEKIDENGSQRLIDMERLLSSTEALVRGRVDAEARWVEQYDARLEQLTAAWQAGVEALRADESARGQAAAARLVDMQAALQSQLSGQLATLGAALEGPMSRLMHTAMEVPQAAATLLAELRQEMSRLSERDNRAVEERTALMSQLDGLLRTLNQAAGEQRVAIDALVAGAQLTLSQAGERLAHDLAAQVRQAEQVAVHVNATAIELSALGEAFNQGVQVFSASNQSLVAGLRGIESSLKQATARSDEQMAYYVAQAREVIDLSIASQQGIVEDMRRLHATAARHPEPEGSS